MILCLKIKPSCSEKTSIQNSSGLLWMNRRQALCSGLQIFPQAAGVETECQWQLRGPWVPGSSLISRSPAFSCLLSCSHTHLLPVLQTHQASSTSCPLHQPLPLLEFSVPESILTYSFQSLLKGHLLNESCNPRNHQPSNAPTLFSFCTALAALWPTR